MTVEYFDALIYTNILFVFIKVNSRGFKHLHVILWNPDRKITSQMIFELCFIGLIFSRKVAV